MINECQYYKFQQGDLAIYFYVTDIIQNLKKRIRFKSITFYKNKEVKYELMELPLPILGTQQITRLKAKDFFFEVFNLQEVEYENN